ncbi:hypothetical protein B296_00055289 [Ensete ventricosum]|uniref:Uncharacterized protein n=1 Tax=Ensete ventricosum TaxID=4639 RepID=A0A426Y094_ENSVE|nr:hypothetical protein B296_00055289 [Ensete ventricosum]
MLQTPTAPSPGAASLQMELSIKEGPNQPPSPTGQGLYVNSSDSSLGPHGATLPCEEAIEEPFARWGEGSLEGVLIVGALLPFEGVARSLLSARSLGGEEGNGGLSRKAILTVDLSPPPSQEAEQRLTEVH